MVCILVRSLNLDNYKLEFNNGVLLTETVMLYEHAMVKSVVNGRAFDSRADCDYKNAM